QRSSAADKPTGVSGRKRWPLIVIATAGLFLAFDVVAGWVYLQRQSARMVGLEGTWRAGANSRHTHQFWMNGDVDSWYGSLPMGSFMKWQRNGNTINIKTDRNWDFVGELEGDQIKGKMILLNEKGLVETTVDEVWRRE